MEKYMLKYMLIHILDETTVVMLLFSYKIIFLAISEYIHYWTSQILFSAFCHWASLLLVPLIPGQITK